MLSTGKNWLSRQGEVSPKIGAVEVRNYSVRKPTLKIGGRDSNYIDTYSVV